MPPFVASPRHEEQLFVYSSNPSSEKTAAQSKQALQAFPVPFLYSQEYGGLSLLLLLSLKIWLLGWCTDRT
ncbi:hypothetical protein CEXT_557811 [Caerostris extrusa]|uniref:Uncharacterized protein n=1 Tax=Caerostris extrusa TaxID=172846 RepID=A0AAV4MDT9_CAEEX|nr:hypothetical protein CEXT_557811 [Caerostris extrusa]